MATRSPAVAQLPQLRMGRRSAPSNLPPALHPHRRTTADPSQGRSAQPPVQGLAHGLDQLLRISGIRKVRCFSLLSFDP